MRGAHLYLVPWKFDASKRGRRGSKRECKAAIGCNSHPTLHTWEEVLPPAREDDTHMASFWACILRTVSR